MAKRQWLMKSEPSVYSIDDLKRDKTTLWEGVRNYQARNFMMNDMQIGDEVVFYHSNAEPAAAVGIAKVSGAAVADPTQFDSKSDYHDPKASKEKPIWYCVEVRFVSAFKRPVSLIELRAEKSLTKMALLQKGQRLSILPLTTAEFETIQKLGEASQDSNAGAGRLAANAR